MSLFAEYRFAIAEFFAGGIEMCKASSIELKRFRSQVSALIVSSILLTNGCGRATTAGKFSEVHTTETEPRSTVQQMNSEEYAALVENSFSTAIVEPQSTFAIDVDTASYSNLRRLIQSGTLPPVGAHGESKVQTTKCIGE